MAAREPEPATRKVSAPLAPHSPVGQLWEPDRGTIAPPAGFAYDLFGNGKSSLQGGLGISYARNFDNAFNVIQNAPNQAYKST
jgi:hypothetical protein